MFRGAGRWVVRLLLLHKLAEFLARTWPFSALHSNFEKFSRWWKSFSKFWRHVTVNILVGLVIALLLHLFHGSLWLQEAEDAGMDWMIQMHAGVVDRPETKYAILDIDEKTFRYWGEPYYTPRKDLLDIIRYATSGSAKLVFVDIDLSLPGHDQAAAKEFRNFIRDYPEESPPLIFVRTFRTALNPDFKPEIRPSFLDDVVTGKANVHWASTLFVRDSDYLVRRWRLWTYAENTQSNIVTIPSIQLLTVAIVREPEKSSQQVHQQIIHALAPYGKGQEQIPQTVSLAGFDLSLKPTPLQQRIIYRFPPGYGGEPLLKNLVLPLLENRQPIANDLLDGRIVLIGSSYAESRDIHPTPLGEMPGVMILANAIHSLQQYDEIRPPETWVKILIEIALIVVVSFAFAWLKSFWGTVLSGAFVIVVLLPISFYFFKAGVWLDFALPLLGVQLHEIVAEIEEQFEE